MTEKQAFVRILKETGLYHAYCKERKNSERKGIYHPPYEYGSSNNWRSSNNWNNYVNRFDHYLLFSFNPVVDKIHPTLWAEVYQSEAYRGHYLCSEVLYSPFLMDDIKARIAKVLVV